VGVVAEAVRVLATAVPVSFHGALPCPMTLDEQARRNRKRIGAGRLEEGARQDWEESVFPK
jgi:hypothetical protein